MPTLSVSGLYCYPVKSCRGISLHSATIGEMGISYDRQWMVVNELGVFVAQRGDRSLGAIGIKTMCLITTEINETNLILSAPDMPQLRLPLAGINAQEVQVRIWAATCLSTDQGEEAASWFTAYLSREVPGKYRLVRMPDRGTRLTELGSEKVAFTDGYPFSLAAEETLQHLNAHLAAPIPMNRFRPNIVMRGGSAFMENAMQRFLINDVEFIMVKKDGRCPITTIDQSTAVAGHEPLRTLGTLVENGKYLYRDGNNVYFGIYLNHSGAGTIRVGDQLRFI